MARVLMVLTVGSVLATTLGCDGGEVVDEESRLQALEAENAVLRDTLDVLSSSAVLVLADDLTIAVPDDASSLADALASLDHYRIPKGVSATITLADGTYALPEAVQFTHPDGARIFVEGNPGSPESVVLFFTGSSESEGGGRAIRARGSVAGGINGVTIRGTNAPGTFGVEAADNGVVYLGPDVVIEEFGRHGIRATRNGVVLAEGIEVRKNGESGVRAQDGGVVGAWGVHSHDNGRHGFRARLGGVIAADPSEASNNGGSGYFAESGRIGAANSSAHDNQGGGYEAGLTGFVEAFESSATNNGGHGYAAYYASSVAAPQSDASGNGEDGFFASASSAVLAEVSTASNNGGDGFAAHLASSVDATDAVATSNGGVGFGAGFTSAVDAYRGTATGNSSGISVGGNGMIDANDSTISDSSGFGVNVYWGGWTLVAGASVSNSGDQDYNLGPWGSSNPLPGEDWGVAWTE